MATIKKSPTTADDFTIEDADKIFDAAKQIVKILKPLDQDSRRRVLHAVCVLLDIPWPLGTESE